MARKAGIYITEQLATLISGRENHDSLSGRISTIAERYGWIIDKHKPELTEPEWNACRDALNGVWLRDTDMLRMVWAEIADADKINGLGAKWEVDAQALSQRIRDMTPAETVALVEAVEAWWAEQG